MKIKVTVKPGAKASEVISRADGTYGVSVRSKPQQGRANAELISLLAEHFGVARSAITIVSGLKSRYKVINIS